MLYLSRRTSEGVNDANEELYYNSKYVKFYLLVVGSITWLVYQLNLFTYVTLELDVCIMRWQYKAFWKYWSWKQMPIAVTLFAPMFHTASNVHHVLLCYPYLVARVNGKMMLRKRHRCPWIVYMYNTNMSYLFLFSCVLFQWQSHVCKKQVMPTIS